MIQQKKACVETHEIRVRLRWIILLVARSMACADIKRIPIILLLARSMACVETLQIRVILLVARLGTVIK